MVSESGNTFSADVLVECSVQLLCDNGVDERLNLLILSMAECNFSRNVLITENVETCELEIGDEITENVLTPLKRNPIRTDSVNAKIVREIFCDYFCEESQVP